MTSTRYTVDADAGSASVLDPAFYADPGAWTAARDRVFARSWQWLGDLAAVAAPRSLAPRTLLPGLLDEPLLLARDAAGELRCLSNVCTHRGSVLVERDGAAEAIRCRYHARRFDLAGRVLGAPGFEDAPGFPSAADDLPQCAFHAWANLGFASPDPAHPWDAVFGDMVRSVGALPLEVFVRDPQRDRDFEVRAHWALYVENYLEGFHVPYVHPGLAKEIALPGYRVETFAHSVLQVAHAKTGQPAFAPGACGGERDVAALYWWIFPNLMLNFYPWGLSLNHVQPFAGDRTRVVYRGYVWQPELATRGAGAGLDRVEAEDAAIVEAVQGGVRSRLYGAGRYSARHERGVHHFHRLLCGAIAEDR